MALLYGGWLSSLLRNRSRWSSRRCVRSRCVGQLTCGAGSKSDVHRSVLHTACVRLTAALRNLAQHLANGSYCNRDPERIGTESGSRSVGERLMQFGLLVETLSTPTKLSLCLAVCGSQRFAVEHLVGCTSDCHVCVFVLLCSPRAVCDTVG
jgi:hypothetical protein